MYNHFRSTSLIFLTRFLTYSEYVPLYPIQYRSIVIIIYLAQIDLHLQRVASIHWLEVFSYRLSDELDFAAVFSSSDILPKRWCSSWNVYFVGVEKRFFQYTLIVSSDNVRYERSLLPVDKAAWVFRFRNFL